MRKISIVVPFYNEGSTVFDFFQKVLPILDSISQYSFELICVDDGSSDNTADNIIAVADKRIKIIQFSRNFHKEAALTAGLDYATGDAVIPMDADLQDPPELIFEMLKKWEDGFEVVLAKRIKRSTDSWFKKFSAIFFYKIYNWITDFNLPENVGDFRLIDRIVVESIKCLPERQRFMKGLFAWVGFKTAVVEYDRKSRISGKTKWSKWKLWNFALEGVTSFSTVLLRVWSYIGLFFAVFALGYGSWRMFRVLLNGVEVPGYASIFVAVLFLGGVQLIGIGVLGEYIGRTYLESKRRPLYFVRKTFDLNLSSNNVQESSRLLHQGDL